MKTKSKTTGESPVRSTMRPVDIKHRAKAKQVFPHHPGQHNPLNPSITPGPAKRREPVVTSPIRDRAEKPKREKAQAGFIDSWSKPKRAKRGALFGGHKPSYLGRPKCDDDRPDHFPKPPKPTKLDRDIEKLLKLIFRGQQHPARGPLGIAIKKVAIGTAITTEKRTFHMNIKRGQYVDFEIEISPAGARVDGKLSWEQIDGPEVVIKASPETGLVGRVIVPADAEFGEVTVRVTGDADLTGDVKPVSTDIVLTIEAPTAENIAIKEGLPVTFEGDADDVEAPAEPLPPAPEVPAPSITSKVARSGKSS